MRAAISLHSAARFTPFPSPRSICHPLSSRPSPCATSTVKTAATTRRPRIPKRCEHPSAAQASKHSPPRRTRDSRSLSRRVGYAVRMPRPNPPPLLAKISKWLEQQEYGELGYFEVELGRVDDARSPRLAAECAGFLRM